MVKVLLLIEVVRLMYSYVVLPCTHMPLIRISECKTVEQATFYVRIYALFNVIRSLYDLYPSQNKRSTDILTGFQSASNSHFYNSKLDKFIAFIFEYIMVHSNLFYKF